MPLALITFCAVTAFTGAKNLVVTSPVFTNNGVIPVKYTCKGSEFSPPLSIGNIPPDATSLVIIADDPDATKKVVQQKVCIQKPKHVKRGAKKSVQPSPYAVVQESDCFTQWIMWNIDVNS